MTTFPSIAGVCVRLFAHSRFHDHSVVCCPLPVEGKSVDIVHSVQLPVETTVGISSQFLLSCSFHSIKDGIKVNVLELDCQTLEEFVLRPKRSGCGWRHHIIMSDCAMLKLLVIQLLVCSSTGLEGVESEGPAVGTSNHWIHVQKCCPEAHMMVEVASRTTATTYGTGSKFECQLQNDTTFRWAPDFLDEQNNLLPFEGSLDSTDDVSTNDFNITKFCIPDGPCISAIVGKPQCGPVRSRNLFPSIVCCDSNESFFFSFTLSPKTFELGCKI